MNEEMAKILNAEIKKWGYWLRNDELYKTVEEQEREMVSQLNQLKDDRTFDFKESQESPGNVNPFK